MPLCGEGSLTFPQQHLFKDFTFVTLWRGQEATVERGKRGENGKWGRAEERRGGERALPFTIRPARRRVGKKKKRKRQDRQETDIVPPNLPPGDFIDS